MWVKPFDCFNCHFKCFYSLFLFFKGLCHLVTPSWMFSNLLASSLKSFVRVPPPPRPWPWQYAGTISKWMLVLGGGFQPSKRRKIFDIIDTRLSGPINLNFSWQFVTVYFGFADLVHGELPCQRGPSCLWEAWVMGWSGSTQKTRTLLWQCRMWAILCLEVRRQSFHFLFFSFFVLPCSSSPVS